MLQEARVDLEMQNIKERSKTVDLVQEFYSYIDEKYNDYVHIYTDGSKEQKVGATGAAVAVPSHQRRRRRRRRRSTACAPRAARSRSSSSCCYRTPRCSCAQAGGQRAQAGCCSTGSNQSSKPNDGWDSQADDEDEKKIGLKQLIKQLPHRHTMRRFAKDVKGSLDRDNKDWRSPSSSSDEDENEKKRKQKQKKIRQKLSNFFKLRDKQKKEEVTVTEEFCSQRPSECPADKVKKDPLELISPNHSPEFYNEVAGKLEKIARRSTKIKTQSPTVKSSAEVCDKEVVVQQLVQVLSLEGDSMNTKIQSDPFLRTRLARLSYTSFAKVLDSFSSSQVSEAPALPPSASPTLRRMAVSMEASRRIVTATGIQRMQGFAQHYMENFVPWVRSHGGWESVADLQESMECD
ncbi:uncharacterized protein bcl2l12 isoform 1-T1 [Odontesthes bonariensis]